MNYPNQLPHLHPKLSEMGGDLQHDQAPIRSHPLALLVGNHQAPLGDSHPVPSGG